MPCCADYWGSEPTAMYKRDPSLGCGGGMWELWQPPQGSKRLVYVNKVQENSHGWRDYPLCDADTPSTEAHPQVR